MAPKKPDTTRITDNGALHPYRIELPILIDDMQLSVYAFRLYAHFKRRAGDAGTCYEGTRSIATICGMSVGQVTKAKAELEAAGVIERTTKGSRGGQMDVISMVDLWPQNMRTYCKDSRDHVVMPNSESVHHTNTSEESVHTANTSPQALTTRTLSNLSVHTGEIKRSPGERKKILNKDEESPPPALPETSPGGGGDSYETEVRALLGGYNILGAAKVAAKYTALDARPPVDAIRAAVLSMTNSDPNTPNRIYRRLMDSPPPWPAAGAVAAPQPPPAPVAGLSAEQLRDLKHDYTRRS